MSIAVMTRVWEMSQRKGSELLLLLALADHANDEGECYPSVMALARKTRLSERNVRYLLRDLEESGELETLPNAGRAGCNRYRILPPANFAPGSPAPEGGNPAPKGGQWVAPEPSIEPSENRQEKEPRRITEAFRAEMRQEFPDLDEAAEFDKATNHIAYRKAIDKRRYYRNWLANARRFAAERRNHATNRNGHRPGAQSQFVGAGDSPRPGRAPDLVG